MQVNADEYNHFLQVVNEKFKSKADLHYYFKNKLVSLPLILTIKVYSFGAFRKSTTSP